MIHLIIFCPFCSLIHIPFPFFLSLFLTNHDGDDEVKLCFSLDTKRTQRTKVCYFHRIQSISFEIRHNGFYLLTIPQHTLSSPLSRFFVPFSLLSWWLLYWPWRRRGQAPFYPEHSAHSAKRSLFFLDWSDCCFIDHDDDKAIVNVIFLISTSTGFSRPLGGQAKDSNPTWKVWPQQSRTSLTHKISPHWFF